MCVYMYVCVCVLVHACLVCMFACMCVYMCMCKCVPKQHGTLSGGHALPHGCTSNEDQIRPSNHLYVWGDCWKPVVCMYWKVCMY